MFIFDWQIYLEKQEAHRKFNEEQQLLQQKKVEQLQKQVEKMQIAEKSQRHETAVMPMTTNQMKDTSNSSLPATSSPNQIKDTSSANQIKEASSANRIKDASSANQITDPVGKDIQSSNKKKASMEKSAVSVANETRESSPAENWCREAPGAGQTFSQLLRNDGQDKQRQAAGSADDRGQRFGAVYQGLYNFLPVQT